MAAKDHETRYQLLIRKLEEFSKKFYKNELIRGGLFFSTLLFASFLIIGWIEYWGHFSITVRTFLFYAFLATNLAAFFYWIGLPVLHLLRLKEGLNYYQAARIIGKHFPDVRDKLLNTLQLHDSSKNAKDQASKELIYASIEQRVKGLQPLPFSSAVDLRENIKYLKYAAIPLALILITFAAVPSAIVDSTQRVVEHRNHFEAPAPFEFSLKNDSLRAVRNQEFEVNLEMEGEQIPAEVFVYLGDNRHRMQQEDARTFSYTFRNPQRTSELRFYADGHYSTPHELEVHPRPALNNFTVFLDYPRYTGMEPEENSNIGDLTVPEGTEITWVFETTDVDEVMFAYEDTAEVLQEGEDATKSITLQAMEDFSYSIRTSNEYFTSDDTLTYFADVIPDEPPQIRTEQRSDSLNPKIKYFQGEISDDYGFTQLRFNYRTLSADRFGSEEGEWQREQLDFDPQETAQSFFYQFNIDRLNIGEGEYVEYYFDVWDNDQVNGPKSARSETYHFRAPTRQDLAEESQQMREDMQGEMDQNISEMQNLRQELQELEQELMGQEDLDWQDEDQIQELIERHQELQDQIDRMGQDFEEQMQQRQELGDMDEDMRRQHEQMQELMEEMMDEGIQDLLEEMQDALDEDDKDRLQDQLRELESQDRFSEREMERVRELFNELDFEQELRDNIEDLREMAEDQQRLSEETGDESHSEEELQEKQEEMQEEFEDFEERMEELQEKNEELQNQRDMDDFDEEMQDIQQEMEDALERLEEMDRDGAQEHQEQGGQQMEEMAEQMQQMQMEMEMDAAMVNYETLRRILQNLHHFSFKQEELLKSFGEVEANNPRFVELGQDQGRLGRYANLIEDSLHALSMRMMEIGPIVNQEMNEINYHLEQARDNVSDRNQGSLRRNQREIMTSANNLAAMLSDILDNLQQQMAAQMEGEQMSQQMQPMPSDEPSMERMQELQEELGEQMEELHQEGDDGEEGEDGEMPSEELSEEYGQIIQEQRQLRQQLQEMREQMEEDGEGGEELEQMEEDMQEIERDLLEKNIDDETLQRQEEISVRMLEYEESERDQDKKEERRAEEAEEYERTSPEELEEFFREEDTNIERLKTTPPRLNSYYQDKVEEYFRSLSPEEED